MKINQIVESTTSGSIASVAAPIGKTLKRGGLFKGKKTSKPFFEGKVKELSMDLKKAPEGLNDEEFKKKYKKTKAEMREVLKSNKVNEADIAENDLILVPGQGHRLKPGFIPKEQDRRDHEVEMARSDLFQAAKNAKTIYELISHVTEDDGLEGWVQEKIIKANDYLNAVREYYEHKQLQEMTAGTIAGGIAAESTVNEKAVSKAQQRFMGMVHAAQKGEKPASKEVAKVAKSMGKKAAKDFAATKHKGLPEKVKKDK